MTGFVGRQPEQKSIETSCAMLRRLCMRESSNIRHPLQQWLFKGRRGNYRCEVEAQLVLFAPLLLLNMDFVLSVSIHGGSCTEAGCSDPPRFCEAGHRFPRPAVRGCPNLPMFRGRRPHAFLVRSCLTRSFCWMAGLQWFGASLFLDGADITDTCLQGFPVCQVRYQPSRRV